MKNLTKKLLVLLVAILMFASTATVVHAENEHNKGIDQAENHEGLEISGLEEGDKVELYKLYKAVYSNDGKTVDNYEFTNDNIVDGGEKVVIVAEQLYTEADQTAGTIPAGNDVGDVKVAEVSVKIADLPKDENGKILVEDAKGVKVGETTYKAGDANVDLTAAKALNDKYPFTISGDGTNVGPTESQILAISAAIAAGTLDVPKVDVWKDATTKQDLIAGDHGTVQATIYAKEKADASTSDTHPAIYDGTGIYLGRITPVDGSDTLYNPIIVSAGYKKEGTDTDVTFVFTDLNVSTATYTYEVSKGTAKKSTPSVDKTVTGGFLETGNKPLVACELDHTTPYNYDYATSQLPNDALTYIKTGYTQEDIDNALKGKKFKEQDGKYVVDPNGTVEAATALAAMITPDVEEAATANSTDNIRSGALGSLFTYTIEPTIPDYPENAVNKTLWFADRMGKGLDYVDGSLVVELNDTTKLMPVKYIAADHASLLPTGVTPDYVYLHEGKLVAYAKEENNGFRINFVYDNLPKTTITNQSLKLVYQAVLNDEAFVGLPGNPNVATMVYSNNPDKGSTHKTLDKPSGEGNKEIEDYEIIYTSRIKFRKVDENGQPLKGTDELKGAIFGLYAFEEIKDSNNDVLYTKDQLVHTIEIGETADGVTVQVAPGKYYFKEIKAPEGYQLNNNKYPENGITVSWTEATKKYTVSKESWEYTTTQPTTEGYTAQVGWLVGGTSGDEFYQLGDFPVDEWTYNETAHTLTHKTTGQVIENAWAAYIDPDKHVKADTVTEETVTRADTTGLGWVEYATGIPNTKIPSLPSTGGIGTYLFTIAGVAIIATAAFMLIFRRREEHNH